MRVPRVALIAAPILVAGLLVPVAANAAPAGPDDGVYYLQSVANGLNAAQSANSVVQHRPKGNEDHQQWSVRTDGDGYRIENADAPGQCLGRTGTSAAMLACGVAEAGWQIEASGPGRWRVKDP